MCTFVYLYADNHTGSGGSWRTSGTSGTSILQGNLRHLPWSTLCSAKNELYGEYIGSGVGIDFLIDDRYAAMFRSENVDDQVAALVGGLMDWW